MLMNEKRTAEESAWVEKLLRFVAVKRKRAQLMADNVI